MMNYKYQRLTARIIKLFKTQTAFAKALGRGDQYISRRLNGITEFSQSDIVAWAELLKIDKRQYGEFFFS